MTLASPALRASAGAGPSTGPAIRFQDLSPSSVTVDAGRDVGPLELWRHGIGLGGINSRPLPANVLEGLNKLHGRLIRVFIQEFFNIYPAHGRFDWSRLDPYMDALDKTGAKVVAAITIKPGPLFPRIDPSVWQPADVKEWQRVIGALVKRYSVDRHIVTYWEIGNETDIGENGGCPYLIADPADYARYYAMTIDPIVAAFPQAKVGGPGVANAGSDYLPRFVERCRADHLRLDFISWHIYSDDPANHAANVQKFRRLLEGWRPMPQMLVTEWNKGFDPVSVEEMAFDPRRAADAAACILAMNEAKVDGSFYYHAWDQVCDPEEFKPFFKDPQIMYHHWNEVPHRFGLFGVNQEVRPQYFVFRMLASMGDRRVAAESNANDLRVLASRATDSVAILLVNFASGHSTDHVATVRVAGLKPGRQVLRVERVDRQHHWSSTELQLIPTETREVDVREEFSFQVYCPGDSVTLAELHGLKE